MSLLDVNTAAVDISALTETILSGEMAASTAAGSAALTGVVPLAADADSAAFAAALNAAGTAYLGAAAEHVGQRVAFAGGQSLSSISYLLNELASATNLSSFLP
ncbi:PE domain-containing protein [Mycobacterium talmoniae]|uniref:PE domain-containing protein n=1 Tax=Mycobacterium talmoniae TaxID=1858794 RepID=A0A1S1MWD9_9MYCO|nr:MULTISPECIES: PE domain-containing protein [Mycobacterium]OHU93102.1 hypothetical protein BKN37_24625 [Mycobacterium talmoniae]PQM45944.1 hypothetical protein C1Y40_03887 [Mycobacterium talmoniae]TDH57286.1 PE domain-containing protein [Mycobacterium eburneum]